MRHLGALIGTGRVAYGAETARVKYEITVVEDRRGKSASGQLTADSRTFMAIMNAPGLAKLNLESGGSVDFIISKLSVPSDRAEIQIVGPVPNF